MKKLTALVMACAAAAVAAPAAAQFAKPEDAIKYRQSAMFLMQQNFGRVAAMASGRVPFDAKVATDSAAVAEFISRLPWAAYGEGTDKGRETRAKPEVSSDKTKFNEHADKLQLEMGKLSAAAKAGNVDALKVAVSAVGGTCKTCHDAFRKD
jgi:cytochrome c556